MKVPFLSLTAVHDEIGPQLDEAYRRVIRSGWYILGEEVEAFEQRFARFCGARHCVGVGNGRIARHRLAQFRVVRACLWHGCSFSGTSSNLAPNCCVADRSKVRGCFGSSL